MRDVSLGSGRSETDYFTMLLAAARQACEAGDYGIAAALVVRSQGAELVSVGRNTVLSGHDPLGHAEINAIRGIQSLLGAGHRPRPAHAPCQGAASSVFIRPVRPVLPPGRVESVLYASLEPCPMCAVAIISSRIGRVVIAAHDEQGGALAAEGLSDLPPAWSSLASQQGLVVDVAAAGTGPEALPAELADELSRAFLDTKDARDAEVSQGVLLRADIIAELGMPASPVPE